MAPYIDEALLDDPDELSRKDSRSTLRALASAGAQVREALHLSREAGIDRLADQERPRSVLVAAIGGSSIVADVLELLAEPGSPVPVQARRNLPLPGWVGPLDLVVAVSLSGRAPGPLAVAAEAARRGASLLTVGLDDSPLAEVTRRARGTHIGIGRNRTSSRTALWTLLAPVLVGADRLGLLDAPEESLLAVADRLDERAEELRPSSEAFVNPAKLLAVQLAETVPVVLGDGPLGGVAAARASSMLARTARIPALWGELPDAASGIVACFDGPYTAIGGRRPGTYDDSRIRLGDIDTSGWEPHHFDEPDGELLERPRGPRGTAGRDLFADPYLDGPAPPQLGLLMLRDAPAQAPTPETVEAETLTDAVLTTARDAGVRVMEVRAGAGDPVVRLADHVAMVDFAATYLAIGLGLDPSVSPHVADLRDRTS
ncbi:SIS domain-containing protein [Ornithinimicrobium pekingense]|uniref:Bifunctional glucose-6-phosphate/mannose-6-phosphate isomerase n=1 Tax=Ornithinimicrobium pekingense TaxID=384677 RepID=A0ABQ2F856_9MICO|nr:SIS domain-containing protein [Ornithinimicrobium pekingense]GGK67166.1 bifunctional glucose-6-phosphate/mannose-6-phosphate isomerase [Ornithinimicrobium pekingense]